MNCLCGTLRCNDQGFCWKEESCGWWSKHAYVAALCVAWIREPHTSVWVKNGIRTAGRARRFFLALVVSVTYQPWHIYTFHLCGCWNARRLNIRYVRTGKRVFRNCQYSNVREDRPSRSKECVVLGHLLECLESERSLPLASTHDGNPISNTCISALFVEPSMAT